MLILKNVDSVLITFIEEQIFWDPYSVIWEVLFTRPFFFFNSLYVLFLELSHLSDD